MQRKALKELNRYRAVGTNRALVVAAAGSGKTYLAAFDALNFNPTRLLYIVHEGSILKKSLETFQDVFGSNVSYGIYSGTSKESDADFVFATNITMCKTLELFARDAFDYIIIDECHHATAETYKKIIESGDRAEIFRLIKTLCVRLEEQQKAGKKPHLIDERFLKEAETVLFDEFAFVLNIERESVSDYIKTELEKL